MAFTTHRLDQYVHRIEDNGKVVALAVLCTNKLWALCDTNEVKITQRQFLTPKAAAEWLPTSVAFTSGDAP